MITAFAARSGERLGFHASDAGWARHLDGPAASEEIQNRKDDENDDDNRRERNPAHLNLLR